MENMSPRILPKMAKYFINNKLFSHTFICLLINKFNTNYTEIQVVLMIPLNKLKGNKCAFLAMEMKFPNVLILHLFQGKLNQVREEKCS